MRNLKRALSLALASIMLLGMMVTGAGAASNSFTDFDQIVNQEAAEVTSGLGIFDGYTDGSFGPEKVVTRAEMAVIICKLLNGSDVDPGNFTGISKFTDVPAWAEGYVNYCAASGIVVGVGEGKFNPSATVTTVEAATMLLKALGYFTEEDKLKEDWKTVVTGRATTLGLYGNLVLKSDEGLSRDNVAELVFHTLFAQRVAYDDNRQLYVKNTNRDVVVTNGTSDKDNTFAMNTFGMWYIDGVVTANSYTDDSLSETTNNAPRTDVLFDDLNDYMGSNKVSHYPFEYTTGLDMIAHAARVYYSMDRNAPVVYAIVDRATKVEYITYNGNATRLAEAANDAGFRRNTINAIHSDDYLVNYDWDVTVKDLRNTAGEVNLTGPDISKTLIVISNSTDSKVDYVIVLDQYLDTVKRVAEKNGVKEYDLTTIDGDDQNIAHDEFSDGDYAVVTDIGKQGDMFNLNAPELVSASITKITGVSDDKGRVKSIIADGTTYAGSPVADHRNNRNIDVEDALEDTTNFEHIKTLGDATLILDFQGKCIGLAEPESINNYAYAAQFGVRHITNSGLNTKFQLTVELFFQDGTSGVYVVNTSDNLGDNAFGGTGWTYERESEAEKAANKLNGYGYPKNTYSYDPYKTYSNDKNGESGLGVYRVILRGDDTAVLVRLGNDVAGNADDGSRLVQSHSTIVMKNGDNLTDGTEAVYQTNKTVYFYVSGEWGNGLSVGARTGIANAKSFTHSAAPNMGKIGDPWTGEINLDTTPNTVVKKSDTDDNGENDSFVQILLNSNRSTGVYNNRKTVEAVMVYGIDLGGDSELYFYKEGNYHIEHKDSVSSKAVENDRIITYDLYKADGEMISKTYDNDGKYYDANTAASEVSHKPTGWYKITSKTIEPEYVLSNRDMTDVVLYNPKGATFPDENIKNVYVLNAETYHDEFQENIYTTVDKVGGIILSGAKVIDTVDCGLDSVNDIARACAAGHLVRISYTYKTTGSGSYEVKTIFITGFTPDAGIKVSTGSGKNLVVNYTGDGYLYIFTRHGYKPTPAVVAEAVKAELERYGFQNVTAQVENIANTGVTTWKVEGMWNGVKYVFTGTGEFTRSTAEIVVNNKISYVWVDGKLTAERLGLANGDYKINQTTVNEKGDEEKRAGYVRVTTENGKKVVAFYDADGTARPDLTSFNDFIIAGDVVVFTTVNNFKPAEPTTIKGEVSESLTGVTATFNGLAEGVDISASVGAPVTIEITGAAAAPESRATVTTFENGKVYTVTINGAEYTSTAAKDNKITVTYTIKSGDTKIEITDIVEKVETVEGTVTLKVADTTRYSIAVTDAEGAAVADGKITEAGTYNVTITDTKVPATGTTTYVVACDDGVTTDGTSLTFTYEVTEIPEAGKTVTFTVTATTEGGTEPPVDGELPAPKPNNEANPTSYEIAWYDADKDATGPAVDAVKADLAKALGVTADEVTLIMSGATGNAQVGDKTYAITTARYWKVSVKDSETFVYVKVGTTAVAGLGTLTVGNYIAGDEVMVASGSQIEVTTAGSATLKAAPTGDTVLTPAALVDTTAGSFNTGGTVQVLVPDGTGASAWTDAKTKYVAFGQKLKVVGAAGTDGKYVQLFMNGEAQGEAAEGTATGREYGEVIVGADTVKDGKITLDEKAGYKVILSTTGETMGIASVDSATQATLAIEGVADIGKRYLVVNATNKAIDGGTNALEVELVTGDATNGFVNSSEIVFDTTANSGYAEPAEDGTITVTPATLVDVGTGLTLDYKFGSGDDEIAETGKTADEYYVAEGAVVTIKEAAGAKSDRIDVITGENGTPVAGTPAPDAAGPSVEKTVGSEKLTFTLVQNITGVELGTFTGIPVKGQTPTTSVNVAATGSPANSVTSPTTSVVAATTNPELSGGNYVAGIYKFTVTLSAADGFYFSEAVTPTVASSVSGAYTLVANSAELTEDGKLVCEIQVELS